MNIDINIFMIKKIVLVENLLFKKKKLFLEILNFKYIKIYAYIKKRNTVEKVLLS